MHEFTCMPFYVYLSTLCVQFEVICISLFVCVCVSMHACMHVSSSYTAVPHLARHSLYSSALLIAGCWSKIIVIFQPVGLKSYNIMKCIKKRGEWQTGGMLNQMQRDLNNLKHRKREGGGANGKMVKSIIQLDSAMW